MTKREGRRGEREREITSGYNIAITPKLTRGENRNIANTHGFPGMLNHAIIV